jgi:hypothetical protein
LFFPALKIGCSRLPMMFQDLLGPSKSVSNSVLVVPKEPVSAMRGNSRLALADREALLEAASYAKPWPPSCSS